MARSVGLSLSLSLSLGLALSAAAPHAALADPVTVETATGPVAITGETRPLVVFDVTAIDTLEALGVEMDGVPDKLFLPYLADVAEGAETVGTLFEPDFEALARMAPGLIIVGGRSSPQREALSDFAPTIDMTIWGMDVTAQAKTRLAAYGALFDRGAEAERLAEALDQRIAEARAAIADKGRGLILLTNGGKISAYGRNSRFGWLHEELGLPEAYPEVKSETHGEAVSFEFIAQLNPDWLLVVDRGAAIDAGGEAARATLDNPLVARTTAAKQDQIIYLEAGPLYIGGGGVQSLTVILDQIIAGFGAKG
ncbi:siderophore ABC transporter substrate-binding protein [Roseovarius sp. C7]|uniref:siderophore ABC transporter substrate-binding protein n=1 Tax=Roseovarius sp. C7 TaxID=3398643 RepID=UPI0039F6D39A